MQLVMKMHSIRVNVYHWVIECLLRFSNHFSGTLVAARCEYLTTIHGLFMSTNKSDNEYTVRVTLTSPTGSPSFYNLPSITTRVNGSYQALLSITQHFGLITDCNEENVSTRQCELLCREKFISEKCTHCRSS